MKTLLISLFSLALLLMLTSCDTFGLGPKQESEITFDMIDGNGDNYFPDNKTFTLRQFSSAIPSGSLFSPAIQSPDSSWVIRVVNIDPTLIQDIDSMHAIGFNIQFYQKESNDLLVLDPICSCLNYPDATTFNDRFFANTSDFTDEQRIFFTYRRTFSIFVTDPAEGDQRSFEITSSKRVDNNIYMKGNFSLPYSLGANTFRMDNGSFQIEILY